MSAYWGRGDLSQNTDTALPQQAIISVEMGEWTETAAIDVKLPPWPVKVLSQKLEIMYSNVGGAYFFSLSPWDNTTLILTMRSPGSSIWTPSPGNLTQSQAAVWYNPLPGWDWPALHYGYWDPHGLHVQAVFSAIPPCRESATSFPSHCTSAASPPPHRTAATGSPL